MEQSAVVVPWEYWVCSECLEDNPYAIWLIKEKCLNPRRHYPRCRTLVSIEPSTTMLVKMRPLPKCALTFHGQFALCRNAHQISAELRPELCRYRNAQNCGRRDSCTFAHSEVERETWNFIKVLFRGTWCTY